MPNLSTGVSASATAPALSAFRAAHPDITAWSAVDFDVYEHLIETAPVAAPLPVRIPSAPSSALSVAELRATTEIAYLERDRQLFEQVRYELAAGGGEL